MAMKIGPKEQAVRDMRIAQAERAQPRREFWKRVKATEKTLPDERITVAFPKELAAPPEKPKRKSKPKRRAARKRKT